MPKIVSNTTPIISLLKLNRLELLQNLYKQIYIPTAVHNEIEAGKAEAIVLATELNADLIILDEKLKSEILKKVGEE